MAGLTGLTIPSELINIVTKSAPLLGSLLGSPLAGIAISLLASHFNISPDAEKILQAIKIIPDVDSSLKKLEMTHQETIKQLSSSDYLTSVNDRISAREREEKIIAATGKRDWVLDVIAILVIIGFFSLCLLNYFFKIEDNDIMVMLIGQISTGFMLCLSYYFGSNKK